MPEDGDALTRGLLLTRQATAPGSMFADADGRRWSVKLGPEAQTEVVTSRVLWAIGYHQPPTYYVPSWQLSGGPGGQQPAARFRPISRRKSRRRLVVVRQRVHRHAAVPRADCREHSAEQLGLEDVNNKNLSIQDGRDRRVVVVRSRRVTREDAVVAAAVVPADSDARVRSGLAQRHRRLRVAGIHQTRRRERRRLRLPTRFYDSVVDLVRPSDVRWTADLLHRLTDAAMGRCVPRGGLQPGRAGALHQEDQSEDC